MSRKGQIAHHDAFLIQSTRPERISGRARSATWNLSLLGALNSIPYFRGRGKMSRSNRYKNPPAPSTHPMISRTKGPQRSRVGLRFRFLGTRQKAVQHLVSLAADLRCRRVPWRWRSHLWSCLTVRKVLLFGSKRERIGKASRTSSGRSGTG